jgi:hypothetical protein
MSSHPPCLPHVLAMIICDMVLDDRISGKKSLIGLFDAIAASSLPCLVNELFVFVALTEGHGEQMIHLRCVKASSNEELFDTETEVSFPDPLSVVEVNFGLCGCEFPEVGEYRFQLFANDSLLCERKFHVTQVEHDAETEA